MVSYRLVTPEDLLLAHEMRPNHFGLHIFNDETGLWDRMRQQDVERLIEALRAKVRVLSGGRADASDN